MQQKQHHQVTCNRCERAFGSSSALAKHLVSRPAQCHRRQQHHVCVKCKNLYASKQSLTNHKRRCNGSNICDKCEKTFSTCQGLANHKRWNRYNSPATAAAVSASGIKKHNSSINSIIDGIIESTAEEAAATAGSKPETKKHVKRPPPSPSVNSILDTIIKPQLATTTSAAEQQKEAEEEENRIITIIQKLDDVYRKGILKLLKALKSSNNDNSGLILPKLFDLLDNLPAEDRQELKRFVHQIDQVRVEELTKAVFSYVTKHDQNELKQIIKQIKKSGNDVSHLNELLPMYFEKDYDKNSELLLPQITKIIENPKIQKLDQLRFQVLLQDIKDNRHRIERILTRLNSAKTEKEYVDRLNSLFGSENLLSNDQYNQLNSPSLRTNRDISRVANVIKMTKSGRGMTFLPRTRRGLYQSLNNALDGTDSSSSSGRKELLAILDELLHRKEIPKKDYDHIIKTTVQ